LSRPHYGQQPSDAPTRQIFKNPLQFAADFAVKVSSKASPGERTAQKLGSNGQ